MHARSGTRFAKSKLKYTGPSIVLISLIFILGQAGLASAIQTTETIPANGYTAIPFSSSQTIHVVYDISVISGPNIDIILTDSSGFDAYRAGGSSSIPYLITASNLNTRHGAYEGSIPSGSYYLIIDNSIQGTAQPNGQAVTVSYSVQATSGEIPLIILIVALVLVPVVLVIIVFALLEKRKSPPFR